MAKMFHATEIFGADCLGLLAVSMSTVYLTLHLPLFIQAGKGFVNLQSCPNSSLLVQRNKFLTNSCPDVYCLLRGCSGNLRLLRKRSHINYLSAGIESQQTSKCELF